MSTIPPTATTHTVSLCLACSSSLPPRPTQDTFLTPCCGRPICPACIRANPRLARYNPCLRCLGGKDVVQRSRRRDLEDGVGSTRREEENVDGGVRDADVYAIGDDEDEDEGGDEDEDEGSDEDEAGEDLRGQGVSNAQSSTFVPTQSVTIKDRHTTSSASSSQKHPSRDPEEPDAPPTQDVTATNPRAVPSKYYIEPNDTLHSISLRFKLDPHLICRLNNLPLSTLRSTPHLLHTRAFLTLPPSPGFSSSSSSPRENEEREARRRTEAAQSRFRSVTKEEDWDVARAYVALAEDPHTSPEGYEAKEKERVTSTGKHNSDSGPSSTLEDRAVDRYMDDDEWEARERSGGRGVSIPRFPLASPSSGSGRGKRVDAQKVFGWNVPVWMRWTPGTTAD
ncbi:hypothetical protein EUX98_g1102 [Antrodiella citrinella]|uniref:LysM domain-containing protein n=1 Tax=Antrodiella citrinella TaxID=2447956 RepID=A0A4S4N295_9APHY|nr:hypothetical protein EUX98_g1102 [Antrodiella citrinella]